MLLIIYLSTDFYDGFLKTLLTKNKVYLCVHYLVHCLGCAQAKDQKQKDKNTIGHSSSQ